MAQVKILKRRKVTVNPLYAPKGWEILSVLRKTDNQIFSIGDECRLRYSGSPDHGYLGKITRLWKSNSQLRVDFGRSGAVLSWTKKYEDLIDKVNN